MLYKWKKADLHRRLMWLFSLSWLSSQHPRFLTSEDEETSTVPTLIESMLTFASCCLVPITKNSVLSSFIFKRFIFETTTTKSSEYNREKEMWKRVRRTGSNETKVPVVEDCSTRRANRRHCHRSWRRRTAEGREKEDENSIFVPNVAFTRLCETKECYFSWEYDQMRVRSFLDFI